MSTQAQTTEYDIYWYVNDHLDTPQKLVDESGNIVNETYLAPFGEVALESETVRNNFRFPGQYHDLESMLYYNWNRYYMPSVGRYNTVEPSNVLEQYIYAGNNPTLFYDATGKNPENSISLEKALIGYINSIGELLARKNDCKALVNILKFAGSRAKSASEMYETLYKIARDNYLNFFGDSCFKPRYKDGSSQPRHCLAVMYLGYKYGATLGEGLADIREWASGGSQADYALQEILPHIVSSTDYRRVWQNILVDICDRENKECCFKE
jgi:RHS repeat-associated protein